MLKSHSLTVTKLICALLRIIGRESTLANQADEHEFISKEYISIGMRPFGETKNKAIRVYAQSE